MGEAEAEQVLCQALLPCLVWRAGKIAAACRFAAVTAVATMFRMKLLSDTITAGLLHQASCPIPAMPVIYCRCACCIMHGWLSLFGHAKARYQSGTEKHVLVSLAGPRVATLHTSKLLA